MASRKTINVSLTFWTDGIAADPAAVVKKAAWNFGTVRFKSNDMHEIKGGTCKHFNKPDELWAAIERAAAEVGVTLLKPGAGA